MKSTIKDVAKLSGVSISTVSRVLNNPELVVQDKREKVQEAIRQLHYSPNALARGLIHKRTKTLGVLIPDISNLFYAEVLRGMEDAAHESGNNLIICNTDKHKNRMISSLNMLNEKQIDGIIFTSEPVYSDSYEVLQQLNIPFVLAATHSLKYEIPSVKVDEEQAAFDAAEYLIKKGHTRIGMISGSALDPISGLPRLRGFIRAFQTYELDFDFERSIEHAKVHYEDSYEAMKRLYRKNPDITAVFASSDERAIGAISYLHENQIKVPGQISVIGFDNTRMAGMCYPKLTTVAQPLYQIGYKAVRKLDQLIKGETIDELRTYMPHRVIERDSVRDLLKS